MPLSATSNEPFANDFGAAFRGGQNPPESF